MENLAKCQAQVTRAEEIPDVFDIRPRIERVIIDCSRCPLPNSPMIFETSTGYPMSDAMQGNRDAKQFLIDHCALAEDPTKVIAPDGLRPNGDPAGTLVQSTGHGQSPIRPLERKIHF